MKKVLIGFVAVGVAIGLRPVAGRISHTMRGHCEQMAAQCKQMAARAR